jgi:hypothetical protein
MAHKRMLSGGIGVSSHPWVSPRIWSQRRKWSNDSMTSTHLDQKALSKGWWYKMESILGIKHLEVVTWIQF